MKVETCGPVMFSGSSARYLAVIGLYLCRRRRNHDKVDNGSSAAVGKHGKKPFIDINRLQNAISLVLVTPPKRYSKP